MRTREQRVSAGRHAAESEAQAKWELGDLALEEAPMGADGAHNGTEEVLRRYAEDIGVEYDTLAIYRRVAAAWSPSTRVLGAAWSVHRELMGEPKLLARLAAKHERVTVDIARRARGAEPTRKTGEETVTATLIQQAMRQPEMVRVVLADKKAEKVVREEQARQWREREEDVRAKDPDRFAKAKNRRDLDQVTDSVFRAARELALALQNIANVDISSNQRELMLIAVKDIQVTVGWLESFLETGDRSFDAQLQKLLEGAA